MNEQDAIVDAWWSEGEGRGSGVLCTVVQVRGSAYRHPGARMLFFPDGRRIGSVSGGCLEGDLCRKGWWLTSEGRATVRVYDTTSDDDAVWEFGLGCNGVVHVLLERADSPAVRDAMQFIARCRREKASGVIATVIRSQHLETGDRLFLRDGELATGSLASIAFSSELLPWMQLAVYERKSRNVQIDGTDVFVEWIGPPVPLVIFGAGHDAIPLVRIAKELGWDVTVADGRPAYARQDRFPEADRVVVLRADDDLAGLNICEESVVVLITHNYPQDEKLLARILPAAPRYLGVLGPRKRAERLLEDLTAPNVHAPIGLDIGADDPAGIAISIVAEIQAVLASRPGGKLRQRPGPIHLREEDESAEDRRPFRPMLACAV